MPLTPENTQQQPQQSITALPICYLSRRGNLAPLYSTAANGPLTSLQGDEVKNTCEDVWSEHSLFAREGAFLAADWPSG